MKTLIVYASKYGCTEDCANRLKEALEGSVSLHNLKSGMDINLDGYDAIVVGGSIYAGSIQKQALSFYEAHKSEILSTKLGLFVCCAAPPPKGDDYLALGFPAEALNHAAAKSAFGGEFRFPKMGLLDKLILKVVSKSQASAVSPRIDVAKILQFAATLQA